MAEFAGTLRERIVIERPISLRNAMGLQESGWEEVCRCLAASPWRASAPKAEARHLAPCRYTG